jgi:long-chain fatty acid transport protein
MHISKNIPLIIGAFKTLLLLVLGVASAQAAGPVHGAKAAGMGTAFIAVADDPSAIVHNPAGITQLSGGSIYGGVTALAPYTRYESPAGSREETRSQIFFPPHLYLTHELAGKDISLGMGLFSPFGIGGRKWDENGHLRYFSTESFMATFVANPTVAWRVSDRLSLAFGLDYMKARNEARRKIDQSLLGGADGSARLMMEGDGWGYNLGLLLRLTDRVNLGLAYRSAIKVDMEGDLKVDDIAPALQGLFGGVSFKTPVSTRAEFPAICSLGASYSLNDKWTLATDFELVRWESFDVSTLDILQEIPPFLVDSSVRLDWDDSWQFKAGFDYRYSEKISLRGGYAYITNPVPEHTLEPGNPDAEMHNLTVGIGYQHSRWALDGFYDLGLYESRKVNNALLAGRFENRVHFLGLSAGYSF